MKLPIKQKYLDEIKKGKKKFEFRDAHITFIGEETGEELRQEVSACVVIKKIYASELTEKERNSDMFEDDNLIQFTLK